MDKLRLCCLTATIFCTSLQPVHAGFFTDKLKSYASDMIDGAVNGVIKRPAGPDGYDRGNSGDPRGGYPGPAANPSESYSAPTDPSVGGPCFALPTRKATLPVQIRPFHPRRPTHLPVPRRRPTTQPPNPCSQQAPDRSATSARQATITNPVLRCSFTTTHSLRPQIAALSPTGHQPDCPDLQQAPQDRMNGRHIRALRLMHQDTVTAARLTEAHMPPRSMRHYYPAPSRATIHPGLVRYFRRTSRVATGNTLCFHLRVSSCANLNESCQAG